MMYKIAIKLLLSQKERLLALFIEHLGKQYSSNKTAIASKVVTHLPRAWQDTASSQEIQFLMDTIGECVHKLYEAIRPLATK